MKDRKVQFLIAQYHKDPFRKEPQNIGVIVRDESSGACMMRMIGQDFSGHIDKRHLKQFNHPNVYVQWIEYWNDCLREEKEAFDILLNHYSPHYQCIEGGEVTEVNEDCLADIVSNLFNLLVTDSSDHESKAPLKRRVFNEFKRCHLIAPKKEENKIFDVQHPILVNEWIKGEHIDHQASFVQKNGHYVVIEAVDFNKRHKNVARDNAGRIAYMFKDIQARMKDSETIVLLSHNKKEELDSNLRYGLEMLNEEAQFIVDWSNRDERETFLQKRKELAQSN
ncbi:MAG: hypothetical protein AB7H80_00480 [Candidatus Kapaibacterium sp.]